MTLFQRLTNLLLILSRELVITVQNGVILILSASAAFFNSLIETGNYLRSDASPID